MNCHGITEELKGVEADAKETNEKSKAKQSCVFSLICKKLCCVVEVQIFIVVLPRGKL